MKNKLFVLFLFSILLISGFSMAFSWQDKCYNSTHLLREANITINGTAYYMNQTLMCPTNNCTTSTRTCTIPDMKMPIELYMFIGAFTIIMIIISLYPKGKGEGEVFKTPIIAFISCILCFVMMASSVNLAIVKCEYIGFWDCKSMTFDYMPFMYLWFGLAIIMFIYAIYETFSKSFSGIGKRRPKDDF